MFARSRSLIPILLGSIFLGSINSAYAWSDTAHSIVAEIAQRHMIVEAQQSKLRELTGGASLSSLAGWADDYVDTPPGEKTRAWHEVPIALHMDAYEPSDCKVEIEGDCLVEALVRQTSVLLDTSKPLSVRRTALRFVISLVADIHQPLRCTAEGQDRGGQQLFVEFELLDYQDVPQREPMSFRQVWDRALIEARADSWGAYVDELETTVAPGLSAIVGTDIQKSIVEWANACHRAAQKAYAMLPAAAMPGARPFLGAPFRKSARPLLDRQLTLAGLRLAEILKRLQ